MKTWKRKSKSFSKEKEKLRLTRAEMFRRSEEHTSEPQSQSNLVCRLLLEKKKNNLRSINQSVKFESIRVTATMSSPEPRQVSIFNTTAETIVTPRVLRQISRLKHRDAPS